MDSSQGVIQVVLADDYQTILDGYGARLTQDPHIRIVGQAYHEADLRRLLANTAVDVLILDIGLPISAEDSSPFPILHAVPKLLEQYPHLHLLIISMHMSVPLIRALADAGISGYIVKDDAPSLRNLAHAVRLIAHDGTYFSQVAYQALQAKSRATLETLPPRQAEVLSLAMSYPDENAIALGLRMGVSSSTVRNHLHRTYIQLGVHTRAAAVAKARELGLITPFPAQPPL